LRFFIVFFLFIAREYIRTGQKNNSLKQNRHLPDTFYMGNSFTYGYNGIAKQLVVDAEIESVDKKYRKKIRALWDTGTNKTTISKKLAERLHLDSVGDGFLYTASGEVTSKIYKANLYLPNGIEMSDIEVVEGTLALHDALIGMDIISRGDFAVSNSNGRTVFIYRTPSIGDFHYGRFAGNDNNKIDGISVA